MKHSKAVKLLKTSVISICEWCIIIHNPTLHQKTTELFTPSLIPLNSWEFTHLSLPMPFMYSLSFSFPQLFICWTWIKANDSEAKSPPSLNPFYGCLHRQTFSKPKVGILCLLLIFIFTSRPHRPPPPSTPPLYCTSTNHSGRG